MREAEQRDRFLVDEMLRHLEVVALGVRGGRDRLETSPEARYALEHATEMLAEAAEKTSRPFKSANVEIPWKGLRKFRHDVAHPYDMGAAPITLDQLWRFARNDAPRIARRLRTAEFLSAPERRARGA
ncbi:MAG: DUF86 domain-containing protein [Thermoplasmata archaeon]